MIAFSLEFYIIMSFILLGGLMRIKQIIKYYTTKKRNKNDITKYGMFLTDSEIKRQQDYEETLRKL